MKVLRLVGCWMILLAAVAATPDAARATVTCWKYCDDVFYSGQCFVSLAQCCNLNKRCPLPLVYVSGDCTDGVNYCPVSLAGGGEDALSFLSAPEAATEGSTSQEAGDSDTASAEEPVVVPAD